MHKTTFQLEAEIASLTAERTKLMQDVDTALNLQDHAQRAEADILKRIGDLMRDWKTGAKTGDDVCVDLFQHFSSTPVHGADQVQHAEAGALGRVAELEAQLAKERQRTVDVGVIALDAEPFRRRVAELEALARDYRAHMAQHSVGKAWSAVDREIERIDAILAAKEQA